jgi:lysophospholipase L1-like esterase
MGDSITLGYTPNYPVDGGFSYTSGFRRYVYAGLIAAGKNPVMVGSNNDVSLGLASNLAGNYHSGLSGTNFGDWLPASYGYNTTNYLRGLVEPAINATGLTPRLIWFMLGANASDSGANATGQLQVIDLVAADYPSAWIVVCSRTPQLANGSSVVNGALLTGVQSRITGGSKMMFFDAFQTITTATSDLPDGLHPSATSYANIGASMVAFINAAFAAGKL